MRAAVVTAFERPVELMERFVLEPGEGQVLVRIEASGLCHTDIHAARGDRPVKACRSFPVTRAGLHGVRSGGSGPAIGRARTRLDWLGRPGKHPAT
jgi:propanol-preferring alcohol dehydrogenase